MNKLFLSLVLASASYQSLCAQEVHVELYKTGFTKPVDIANAGDDRLFIVEQRGRIKIIDQTTVQTLATSFLDIQSRVYSVGNEQGLLGLTFHPNYAQNGYFYVNYTATGGGDTRISRFTRSATDPNLADPTSELIILTIDQPYSNHNAADIDFGPDGYLYISTGDGGSGGDPGNRAQDPTEMLGKILRIDVDNTDPGLNYAVPATNPFVGANPADTLHEIWALGLRNPWRCAFDALNNDFWIADVGQNAWEEINVEPQGNPGRHYGWRCYEASDSYDQSIGCSTPPYTMPIFEYPHSGPGSGLSVTGGFVYRGNDYPDLYGNYIFADYATGNWWTTVADGAGGYTTTLQDVRLVGNPNLKQTDIVTYGADNRGEMYAGDLARGKIYRVGGYCMANPAAVPTIELNPGSMVLSTPNDTATYYEWQLNQNPVAGANAQFFTPTVSGTYRLIIQDANGCTAISDTISVNITGIIAPVAIQSLQVSPNPVVGNLYGTIVCDNFENPILNVFNSVGQVVYNENLTSKTFNINTQDWASGLYTVQLRTAAGITIRKVIK